MSGTTLPADVLEELGCAFCKEYLSQSPIYIYSNVKGSVCGRCPVLSDQNPVRNVIYETVATYVLFPCRFKPYGCTENLLPSEISTHEECCNYKIHFCPFLPLGSCAWQGSSFELYLHYQELHNALLLQEDGQFYHFEIDIFNAQEKNYLLKYSSTIFIVNIKCDTVENIFWCCVYYVVNKTVPGQYTYKIELGSPNDSKRIRLEPEVVTTDTLKTFASVEIHKLPTKIDGCTIECYVSITPTLLSTTYETVEEIEVNEKLLTEFECPVCFEDMILPIYQCINGHSICVNCKEQVEDCPIGREQMCNIRNFTLEKLAKVVKKYCKYRASGCNFVTSISNLKDHQDTCMLGKLNCPLNGFSNCEWNGELVKMLQHMKDHHVEYILENDVVDITLADANNINCVIRNVHGNLFRFIFKCTSNTFMWCPQFIGPSEQISKFVYELDAIDNSNSKEKFFIRRNFTVLTKYEDVFKNKQNVLCIPFKVLHCFRDEGVISFKLHILEK